MLWSELEKRLADLYQLIRELYQVFPRGYCLEAQAYPKISAESGDWRLQSRHAWTTYIH